LYNGMSKTSAWAALYFIFLMTFGNYVLFNLLVAILVEGFATEVCCPILLCRVNATRSTLIHTAVPLVIRSVAYVIGVCVEVTVF